MAEAQESELKRAHFQLVEWEKQLAADIRQFTEDQVAEIHGVSFYCRDAGGAGCEDCRECLGNREIVLEDRGEKC